ncbi:MAG TPA: lysophospholipid acyltransferase family protein [Cellvibrio sp.]|nr:lysophospholipid acyltransferase family protein [Cellvibrio sp.]
MKNTLIPLIFKILGLFPLRLSRALGWAIGNLVWLFKGRNYRMTEKNLRKCLPELSAAELKTLIRESLVETSRTAAEAGAIWRNPWSWLQAQIVEVEGEDLLREELAKGKGLLVLAPHLGNWEVVAPYLASVAPLTAMYQPFPIPALDEMILSGRSKNNINMAPTNRKGVAMLLRALQQGNIVGILPDQVPEKTAGGDVANFFGRPAVTMSLVSSLIERTQCRVVSTFAQRVPGGFKLITLPAAAEIYSADQQESLLGLNLSVEACVRLAPAQYQWEYNRFRQLPKHLRD